MPAELPEGLAVHSKPQIGLCEAKRCAILTDDTNRCGVGGHRVRAYASGAPPALRPVDGDPIERFWPAARAASPPPQPPRSRRYCELVTMILYYELGLNMVECHTVYGFLQYKYDLH